jgi:prepilin-type N-terminal cleavage/methylation domain-containing protein/prepilin-type processing-associated H-X9-DG protein
MKTNHRGFTLIELLVVIAIIAILAAILFPVFAKAREKARQTSCLNNQRQIAVAILMYAQDHDETLPDHSNVWVELNVDRNILMCPTKGKKVANAYVYHRLASSMTLGEIESPEAQMLTADGQHSATTTPVSYDNVAYSAFDLDLRHSNRLLASYVDGHVEVTTGLPFGNVDMVYVEAGAIIQGSGATGGARNYNARKITITKGFFIYKHEITVKQYRAFCEATGATMPNKPFASWSGDNTTWYQNEDYAKYPIGGVSWNSANDYATWAGASLPTEAQWELAARGPKAYIYPWSSNTADSSLYVNVTNSGGTTKPVGSIPAGASPCGALDMAGNVYEFCSDWYQDTSGLVFPAETDPTGPATGAFKVVRSTWYSCATDSQQLAYRRTYLAPTTVNGAYGFRCVFIPPGR